MTLWARRLLIVTIAAHVVLFYIVPGLIGYFVLIPVLLPQRPWTIVSYMFVHAGWLHLLFNMLGLFFFGPRLESRLGSRDFLLLYFLSGIGGAALSVIFSPTAAIVGASGAVFGILLGFARYWPTEPIYIYGIIPVQARWLVLALAIFSLYAGFSGGGRIAHFAHLGGFVAGYLFLRLRERQRERARLSQGLGVESSAAVRPDTASWERIAAEGLHELNRREVERIREKLKLVGVQGLHPEERAFMDRMSQD